MNKYAFNVRKERMDDAYLVVEGTLKYLSDEKGRFKAELIIDEGISEKVDEDELVEDLKEGFEEFIHRCLPKFREWESDYAKEFFRFTKLVEQVAEYHLLVLDPYISMKYELKVDCSESTASFRVAITKGRK